MTPQTVTLEKPDVVILSTRATPILPNVPGIDSPIVVGLARSSERGPSEEEKSRRGRRGCYGVRSRPSPVRARLLCHHCGAASKDRVEPGIHHQEGPPQRAQGQRGQWLARHKLSRVEETGVVVRAEDGTETFIETDAVVIAIGNKPDNSLYDQIQSLGIPLYQIGDCLEPRSAKAAISEAATIGRTI